MAEESDLYTALERIANALESIAKNDKILTDEVKDMSRSLRHIDRKTKL